jgi:ribulose-phosphate 3-epimerase
MISRMTDDRRIEINPTWVPQGPDDLRTAISTAKSLGTSLHIDVNDGLFARPFSWPFVEEGRIGEFDISFLSDAIFCVHLMVSDAREIGEFFINAGAHSIVVHVESLGGDVEAARSLCEVWRARGVHEIGLAILLDTSIGDLNPLLPFFDFVHVLSVATIGAQGAPFDPRALDRIRDLHTRLPDFPIAVDGCVSAANIASLVEAGASRFSVGSAIMRAPDPAAAYTEIKSTAENALQ